MILIFSVLKYHNGSGACHTFIASTSLAQQATRVSCNCCLCMLSSQQLRGTDWLQTSCVAQHRQLRCVLWPPGTVYRDSRSTACCFVGLAQLVASAVVGITTRFFCLKTYNKHVLSCSASSATPRWLGNKQTPHGWTVCIQLASKLISWCSNSLLVTCPCTYHCIDQCLSPHRTIMDSQV